VSRIVTISFTPLDAPGGVPKFNRDLHAAFQDRECVHYSWWDFPWHLEVDARMTEWEKSRTLNHSLVSSRKLLPSDVVIADGFWADGLEHMKLAVSHSHGIWSHLTLDDVKMGKAPDNPFHHSAQVTFRQRWTGLKKYLTAVSDFIADEMEKQWGFNVDRIIDNGVDTSIYIPTWKKFPREKKIIVHGVNDRGNTNKGGDHIDALIIRSQTDANFNVEILSLDEMVERYGGTKAWALSQADIFVHPSGFEGNSMMVAEALACDLPFVGYNVGFAYEMDRRLMNPGRIMDRNMRHPTATVIACVDMLEQIKAGRKFKGRDIALGSLAINVFRDGWRQFVEEIES